MTFITQEQAMKMRFALAALAAATLSTLAAAQMGPGMGSGMGPGMGHGMGPGKMGPADCPMAQGGGPGMMHGRGGHGMGQGMGQGPGLEALEKLNLTDDQRAKITEIRRDSQRKMHALMGSLREVRWKAADEAKGADAIDVAAARKRYDEGAAIHKQMFEARLEARAKAEAVLTKEQREQLRKSVRPGRVG